MMKDRQNIVIIISDQQRWDSLGCNGNDFVKTPYLDEFSKEALNFKNSFTPFPVCTPARATMWTGVYPHAHGLIHNRYGIDESGKWFSRSQLRSTFKFMCESNF